MLRFAHTSDVHLGYQKEGPLRDIELRIFSDMADRWIAEKVDFVLMPGDIFDVNIPEMEVQKRAFAIFRRIYEAGIPIYAVYGSHDFSPGAKSAIDLLEVAGYVRKVDVMVELDDGGLELGGITDEKTGVYLAGLPGRRAGRDSEDYDRLKKAEPGPGFSIFLFHGGITELMQSVRGDSMPVSKLPQGFGYYAGGHLHGHRNMSKEGYPVVYPGTPFAGNTDDMTNNASGTERGYVMVETDGKDVNVSFVPIGLPQFLGIEFDASGMTAAEATDRLTERVKNEEPQGAIVIMRVYGKLASGRPGSVRVASAARHLSSQGAVAVKVGRSGLTSVEYEEEYVQDGRPLEEMERDTFTKGIKNFRFSDKDLNGKKGVDMACGLLPVMRQERLENEVKSHYAGRLHDEAMKIMGLDSDDT